jgi:hypothetical protein
MDVLTLGYLGSFHWSWICGFLRLTVLFAPYWGRGNNLESILLISPVADLSDPVSPLQDAGMQVYNSLSGCRNADL